MEASFMIVGSMVGTLRFAHSAWGISFIVGRIGVDLECKALVHSKGSL